MHESDKQTGDTRFKEQTDQTNLKEEAGQIVESPATTETSPAEIARHMVSWGVVLATILALAGAYYQFNLETMREAALLGIASLVSASGFAVYLSRFPQPLKETPGRLLVFLGLLAVSILLLYVILLLAAPAELAEEQWIVAVAIAFVIFMAVSWKHRRKP